jgi:trans-AT polyketide synthase, acyltransferase and oxidoreductase domains
MQPGKIMNTNVTALPSFARWNRTSQDPLYSAEEIQNATLRMREPCTILQNLQDGRVGVAFDGSFGAEGEAAVIGVLPSLYPEWLGDRSFCEVHGTRFAYVCGAMANGIASTDVVIAACEAGMLGFFGSAGLHPDRVTAAADLLQDRLGSQGISFGMNLIHSPHEPDLENAIVDLYLEKGIHRVSAAAYMNLTPMVVRYALNGLDMDANGQITRQNFVFAKISRPEVAERFLSPAPKSMVDQLLSEGKITAREAELAALVPVSEDIIVEADSGGHTDNQIPGAIFPTVKRVQEAVLREYQYARPIRVGAAGGIGTPIAAAAAYSMGAAFILTGSVNQGAIESGLSTQGKKALAQAALDDVMMAPAADMFEMGVKVQVLKRGTMFGVRAQRLYDVYRKYDSIEEIPKAEKERLEKEIFKDTLENVWRATHKFFQVRDPRENAKAESDPKHLMALVFRWYLGQSSKWAIAGDAPRTLDYQIWCGPAMGAFNAWVKGSFLEAPENRRVVQIAMNLLEGAAVITRANQLRSFGAPVPQSAYFYPPREFL